MVWPDHEPPAQHEHTDASDWAFEPQALHYAFPSPPSMSLPMPIAMPPPSSLATATDLTRAPIDLNGTNSNHSTLTYSASCPSFTALYELSSDDDLIRDIQANSSAQHFAASSRFGYHTHAQLPPPHSSTNNPMLLDQHEHELAVGPQPLLPFHSSSDKSFDALLQLQHEHLDASLRAFPHQQSTQFHGVDNTALFRQPRRPIHASASFTSLASMESEYRRQSASKRKLAGAERWHKMQRHKSFDSTGTSPATSMAFSTYSNAGSSTFASTPEHQFLPEVPDADMIGFSIDDAFPSTFVPSDTTTGASWSMPLSLGGGIPFEAYAVDDSSSPDTNDDESMTQTPADIDLLLSDHERANMASLFDAIRDFEVPPSEPEPATAATVTVSSTEPAVDKPTPAKPRSQSPPLHPSKSSAVSATEPLAPAITPTITPAMTPVTTDTDSDVLPIRERLGKALARTRSRDASLQLTAAERLHVDASPLFAPARASETAGSLWLLLHAARCEFGCEIAGCSVMRRVVRHCLGCDALVGCCKEPCNEAKTILLHVGACRSDACRVCRKLREIDHAHNAIAPSAPVAFRPAAPPVRSPTPPVPITRVPLAPRPAGKPQLVPIQPNPLPTPSNPMGLLHGTTGFPAPLGFSLALYLEQTSATFRAEVRARVEKRVTAAAGQDLIQHMQKKTRLRSLDDLRADARTLVLGELERELHLHLQAYAWAANNRSAGSGGTDAPPPPLLGGHECMLPPYLLSVAVAGFATFYAQQATLHAAVTANMAAATKAGPGSSSSSAGNVASQPAPVSSRHKGSIRAASSASKAAAKTTAKAAAAAADKTAITPAPDKKADAALAV